MTARLPSLVYVLATMATAGAETAPEAVIPLSSMSVGDAAQLAVVLAGGALVVWNLGAKVTGESRRRSEMVRAHDLALYGGARKGDPPGLLRRVADLEHQKDVLVEIRALLEGGRSMSDEPTGTHRAVQDEQ